MKVRVPPGAHPVHPNKINHLTPLHLDIRLVLGPDLVRRRHRIALRWWGTSSTLRAMS